MRWRRKPELPVEPIQAEGQVTWAKLEVTWESSPSEIEDGVDLSVEDAEGYVRSIVYRDGWRFRLDRTDALCPNLVVLLTTEDPFGRYSSVGVSSSWLVRMPTTRGFLDRLVLLLVRDIEDHERLEFLRRRRPDDGQVRLFEPHVPNNVYGPPLQHGMEVYRGLEAWRATEDGLHGAVARESL